MVSVKSFIAAGAAAFISTVACAADMALPPPPQIPYQPVASGWYLRGDIGVGMTDNFSLDYLPNPLNPPNNSASSTTPWPIPCSTMLASAMS